MTLDTRIPVRIGNRYRLFYLTADDEPYQIFPAQQQFLALEDLGEYQVSDILQEAEET